MMDGPADTFGFMVFGFGVILGAIGLFVVSLGLRFRNLRQDLALLSEMDSKEKA